MKHRVTLASIVLLSCAFLVTPTVAWAQCMAIAVDGVVYDSPPDQIDFGHVPVNTTETVRITLMNVPCPDGFQFEIALDSVTADPIPFRVEEDAPPPLIRIPIAGSIDVDVYFSPTEVGDFAGELVIESNAEPPYDLAMIDLIGSGVEPPVEDPADLMAALLDEFDLAVDAGTIWGIGPGSSAGHRLNAFRSQLLAVVSLIDRGADEFACTALQAARAKADGESRPPDFVAGPATGGLVTGIDDVLDALGCGAT